MFHTSNCTQFELGEIHFEGSRTPKPRLSKFSLNVTSQSGSYNANGLIFYRVLRPHLDEFVDKVTYS
jgi:hypothetical protein